MIRRRARRRTEEGFTMAEMLSVIVILGIVMVPLCLTLVSSLTLVPQSGTRTQNATDAARTIEQFSDDIEQSQGIWLYTNNSTSVRVLEVLTTGFNEVSLAPTMPSCQTLTASPTYLFFTLALDQGAGGGNVLTLSRWYATAAGTSTDKQRPVTLQREDFVNGTPDQVMMSGFCSTVVGAPKPFEIAAVAPSALTNTTSEQVDLTVSLYDKTGASQPPVKLSATARATDG